MGNYILGIGFNKAKCFLTVVDENGTIISKENFEINTMKSWKGKKKEVLAIASEIVKCTKVNMPEIGNIGIAISRDMFDKNEQIGGILSKEIKKLFRCDSFIFDNAAASGYAERSSSDKLKRKDFLYMHSDVGIGVVYKEDLIFEAEEGLKKNSGYLKRWDQYNIVENAKALVDKGIGTDIVSLAAGDVDKISLDIILRAASNNDELAEDVVKRAALALGVRAAYLANMFNPEAISIGGGIEGQEGKFFDYFKESIDKFIFEKHKKNVEIATGSLGEEASSVGAALLCKRQLVMEG